MQEDPRVCVCMALIFGEFLGSAVMSANVPAMRYDFKPGVDPTRA